MTLWLPLFRFAVLFASIVLAPCVLASHPSLTSGLLHGYKKIHGSEGRLMDSVEAVAFRATESSISVDENARSLDERKRRDRHLIATGWWSTQGSKIVDARGNEVWYSGVSWYGLENSYRCLPHGVPLRRIDQHLDLMQELGFNLLRIPISTDCVEESTYPFKDLLNSTTYLANVTTLGILDMIIDGAMNRQMRVVLNWLRPSIKYNSTDPSRSGLWFSDDYIISTENYWVKTLTRMADRYKLNPTVIGIGIFHEPHNDINHIPISWSLNLTDPGNMYRAATKAGNAIHAVNENILIFVMGTGDTRDAEFQFTWSGSGFATVAKNLLNLTVPNKVVYETHDFGPLIYDQPFFKKGGLETVLPRVWNNSWGFLQFENLAPVHIGEFGTTLLMNETEGLNGTEISWFKTLIDYIGDYSFRWSVLTWGDGTTHGSILYNDYFTKRSDKYDLLIPIFHPDFGPSVPQSPSTSEKPGGLSDWAIIVISLVSVLVFLLVTILIILWYFRNHLSGWHMLLLDRIYGGKINSARFINLKVLKQATNNFSIDLILGSGGFGTVYKGFVGKGEVWAVKKAKRIESSDILFFHEEVKTISKMNHVNVVKLIGFCDQEGEQILVYEYMSMGTLRNHIRPSRGDNKFEPLSFEKRLSIALDAAKGLEYLHSQAAEHIYHRDVKSDNILLDDNMVAKISDFGLLKRITTDSDEQANTIQGTFGYIDPEFISTKVYTEKSDVFSFGIVLMELLTGMPPIIKKPNSDSILLYEWIRKKTSTSFEEIVDSALSGIYPLEEVRSFLQLTLDCTEKFSCDRPSMSGVVRSIRDIIASVSQLTTNQRNFQHRFQQPNEDERLFEFDSSSDKYITPAPVSSINYHGR